MTREVYQTMIGAYRKPDRPAQRATGTSPRVSARALLPRQLHCQSSLRAGGFKRCYAASGDEPGKRSGSMLAVDPSKVAGVDIDQALGEEQAGRRSHPCLRRHHQHRYPGGGGRTRPVG